MPDRLDPTALDQVRQEVLGDGDFYGPPLSVTFTAANTARDIVHGLGVVPDGYRLVVADAHIRATPGRLWTANLAYLQADAANAHAILRFVVLRQRPVPA